MSRDGSKWMCSNRDVCIMKGIHWRKPGGKELICNACKSKLVPYLPKREELKLKKIKKELQNDITITT